MPSLLQLGAVFEREQTSTAQIKDKLITYSKTPRFGLLSLPRGLELNNAHQEAHNRRYVPFSADTGDMAQHRRWSLRTPKTAAIWPLERPSSCLSLIRVARVASLDGASRLEKGRRNSPERRCLSGATSG